MKTPSINTFKQVIPLIYCYTTPGVIYHNGWCKIGETEQDADTRISQQTQTANILYHLEWTKNAVFDGSGDSFHDRDFHAYLTHNGIERMKPQKGDKKPPEWFHIAPKTAKQMLNDFRENEGLLPSEATVIPYILRAEQQAAVDKAKDYFATHEGGKFLFNCKPRFGKTLTVYDLCKRMNLNKVLIVTNRPAIANSWYEDYCKFLGKESGYDFVSEVKGVKGLPLVKSREQYVNENFPPKDGKAPHKCIEFVSLQDLKGSKYFGGSFDKLAEVDQMEWDILVVDEAHEGVDTYKTDVAFDHIKRKYTLHLSGTPFKSLAKQVFSEDAMYSWTYADEQKAKAEWHSDDDSANPYANLPKLNMYTYQMSDIIKDQLKQGIEINGETEEYAFDLNEFFATDKRGYFIHNEAVSKFLDTLVTGKKYPFSTEALRNELKHTLWFLDRVDSARAMEKKLKKHPIFRNYEIVLAAGDGRSDEDEQVTESAFERVKTAIKTHDKTITLTVGQLTTGVTIPEWTAVLMLSNVKSPSLYMQAAFRAQNPCRFQEGLQFYRKKNAYVFDFDPARTLITYEQFANDLSTDTAAGHGNTDTRKQHIKELLNFFPVIGEDENGEMIALDAAKVLSIPRKIKSTEVVNRGFMSNYLFQNISNVFGAPQEVVDIISQMTPAKEEDSLKKNLTENTKTDLNLNNEGNVDIPEEDVNKEANKLFGGKIYEESGQDLQQEAGKVEDIINSYKPTDEGTAKAQKVLKEHVNKLKNMFADKATKAILDQAQNSYQGDLTKRTRKDLENTINRQIDAKLDKAMDNRRIDINRAQAERDASLKQAETPKEEEQIRKDYEEKVNQVNKEFKNTVINELQKGITEAGKAVVQRVETDKKNKKKQDIESDIRDHLRGFSRTIPSFLMAYGENNTVTLSNFDTIVPEQVFQDVTSITTDQFRFLRDGGDYYLKDDNGTPIQDEAHKKHFNGHLFDEVVFNDSVKEFLAKKQNLANYFENSNEKDIFDYIPPQKTNQIFTPRKVVKEMVDLLEKENPGCFDDDTKTFADLYMKSGMYITEIIKRLYNSPKMKRLYPDNQKRLEHIFAKQVYGLAPTEIIYRICRAYILGFNDKITIPKDNIKKCDTLTYAKKGTLEMKLGELFPELK